MTPAGSGPSASTGPFDSYKEERTMPRAANQKEKVLYVMKILLQETDEAHPLSTEEIIEKLSEAGVKAERKSIYSDMETLRAFGLDVHGTKGRSSASALAAASAAFFSATFCAIASFVFFSASSSFLAASALALASL